MIKNAKANHIELNSLEIRARTSTYPQKSRIWFGARITHLELQNGSKGDTGKDERAVQVSKTYKVQISSNGKLLWMWWPILYILEILSSPSLTVAFHGVVAVHHFTRIPALQPFTVEILIYDRERHFPIFAVPSWILQYPTQCVRRAIFFYKLEPGERIALLGQTALVQLLSLTRQDLLAFVSVCSTSLLPIVMAIVVLESRWQVVI